MVNLCVNARDTMTSAGPRRELHGEPVGLSVKTPDGGKKCFIWLVDEIHLPPLYPNRVYKQARSRGPPWGIYESITRWGHGVANFKL